MKQKFVQDFDMNAQTICHYQCLQLAGITEQTGIYRNKTQHNENKGKHLLIEKCEKQ